MSGSDKWITIVDTTKCDIKINIWFLKVNYKLPFKFF